MAAKIAGFAYLQGVLVKMYSTTLGQERPEIVGSIFLEYT
jgi:hypothetical protein